MNEAVKAVLDNNLWTLATYSDAPNAVPVFFKKVAEDGRLLVGNVFLETTLRNIEANGQIAVSVYDGNTMEGYQIKGHAEQVLDGEEFEAMAAAVKQSFGGALACRSLRVIHPETIIVTTPGPDNKNVL